MNTIQNKAQKIVTILLKDLTKVHTATSLSEELKMSRWGIWKILKKLEKDEFIRLEQIGTGKTGIKKIKLNWDNDLVEKTLAFSLAQEAASYKRWQYDFADLKQEVDFLILYGSILYDKKAGDIDTIGLAKEKKFVKIDDIILKIQQTQVKKIHSINLTKKEFKQELKKPNKAYLDAIKKGIILFGQESFIRTMRALQK